MEHAEKSGLISAGADIINIPNATGVMKNTITQYGELTMTEIDAHVATYINTNIHQTQNDYQMLTFLTKSITL